jgi:hypothetical protein
MTPKKQPEPVAVESQTKRVSDVVWQALIAGLVTIVLASVSAISANYAASKVEQVRVDLKTSTTEATEKLDGIAKVGTETHVLVNSAALINARLYVSALKRLVADKQDPADIEELKKAQQMVTEHEEGQKVLDSRSKSKSQSTTN